MTGLGVPVGRPADAYIARIEEERRLCDCDSPLKAGGLHRYSCASQPHNRVPVVLPAEIAEHLPALLWCCVEAPEHAHVRGVPFTVLLSVARYLEAQP